MNSVKEEYGTFADGLRMLFTKGSLVTQVRLNKRMKEIILLLIKEDMENSIILFPVEDSQYDDFMSAMIWLKEKITGVIEHKLTFNRTIGRVLYFWVNDKKYHYLSDDTDFDNSLQWILNHISKKWSVSELVQSE
jgi:hypothetical protein